MSTVPRATDKEIDAGLARIPGWRRENGEIVRTFDCVNFDGSIAFVNAVASAARAADHHPDIAISWNEVTLRMSTHSAGGLTEKDFELASLIDALRA